MVVKSKLQLLEEINQNLQEGIAALHGQNQELRASETRYRTIFETSGAAMAIASYDYTIRMVNKKFESLSGYSREELENRIKWTQFLYPDDADRVTEYNRQQWKDPEAAPANYEFRFVNRDGQIRHVIATVALIPSTNLFVASLQDITPRKELEITLKRQNERYNLATHVSSAGVFEWNLQTGAFYWDPSIKAFLGYDNQEIANDLETWTSYIYQDDRQITLDSAEAAIRGETPEFHCEHRMLARGGSACWVSSNGLVIRDGEGRPLKMIGTQRDITPRKLAELNLKASEERFRMIWESAGDAMYLINMEGFILAANPAFFELFNLPLESVIGKRFTDFVSEGDLQTIEKDFQKVLSQGPIQRIERQLSRHDGTTIVTEARINSFALDDQQQILLVIVRDITERKRVETNLKQARDQLATLLAVSQNLVSLLDIDLLLNVIFDQLSAVIPYDAAAILSIQNDLIKPLVYRGPAIPEELAHLRDHFAENPILLHLSQFKDIFYINDSHTQETLELLIGGSLGEWRKVLSLYRSWLALPLIVRGELIGSLVLAHTQPDHFDPAARSLAKAFANQAAIAMENARLYRQARETAVTTERMRLARDLHDSVTQTLYAINLYSEASQMALSSGKFDIALHNLDELQSMVREAVTDLRVLIYELRPPVLEEIGLAAALKNRLEAVEERVGLRAELKVEGDYLLPPEVETELFRAAQEALTNVLKHAQANQIQIHLRFEEDLIHLEIRDDGMGFDVQNTETKKGMGLNTLRERIRRLGGNMTFESSPGEGTSLYIDLSIDDFRNAGY